MGTDRPSGWDHKLQASEERGGRDERLEFGYAEVAEFGREGLDGGERRPSGGRKDESVRDQDAEYAFISFGIRNRELVIPCGRVRSLWATADK